jgi:DTW domain-containing protein YfiP
MDGPEDRDLDRVPRAAGVSPTKPFRLENFDVDHHELNRISYNAKVAWWQEEQATGKRCALCWLRPHECFCSTLRTIQADMTDYVTRNSLEERIRVCLYYHYQELGRSANTAHLLEAICPTLCERLIFGDAMAELRFIKEMINEHQSNKIRTCILYPHATAVGLDEWVASTYCSDQPLRLVVLDGGCLTYQQIRTMCKN